jgi:hypothetical protein
MSWVMLFSDVLHIPAALLTALLVKKIDASQEEKMQRLTELNPAWMPPT